MPEEVRDYILCTQLYHCTPLELDEQDSDTIEMHWFIRNETRKVRAEIRERRHEDVDL